MNLSSFIFVFILLYLVTIFSTVLSQEPENLTKNAIPDQTEVNQTVYQEQTLRTTVALPNFMNKLYKAMMNPLKHLMDAPKVNSVMRNIATCVVNGAVELISFYFPAPLIPIIASAAGMMVPFEPVLALRDKIPVTSYRRGFLTALNSFLGTFDRYKIDDIHDPYDPYMTERFNRRMMQFDGKHSKPTTPADDGKGKKGDFFIFGVRKLFDTLDRLRRQEVSDEDTQRQPTSKQNQKDHT